MADAKKKEVKYEKMNTSNYSQWIYWLYFTRFKKKNHQNSLSFGVNSFISSFTGLLLKKVVEKNYYISRFFLMLVTFNFDISKMFKKPFAKHWTKYFF